MVSTSAKNKVISVIVSIAVTILGVGVAIFTSSRISKAIGLVVNLMDALAHGDLSHVPLVINRGDELGTLMNSANIRRLLLSIRYQKLWRQVVKS